MTVSAKTMSKKKAPRRAHDRSRRLLFQHPRTVRDLVRGFISEPWVEQLDFDSLSLVPSDFLSAMLPGEFEDRSNDVLWKVRWKGDTRGRKSRELYVLILVEFQSSCEQAMVLRVLGYIVMLYLRLLKEHPLKKGERLPPVLPFIVYNGEGDWWAPLQFQDLVDDVPESFLPHVPSLTCCLVDEKRIPSETLEALAENLAALIFRTEQSATADGFRTVVEDVRRSLSGPDDGELVRDVLAWFTKVVIPQRFPGIAKPDLESVYDLTNFVETQMPNFIAQAEEKGRQEGRQEGLADAVLQLLSRKFGDVPEDLRDRVLAADVSRLGTWIDQVLSADSIEDVFRDEPSPS